MVIGRLTLDAFVAAGTVIKAFVGSLARACGLDDAEAYRLRLATDEIVTNVAQHGYRTAPGTVELTGGCDEHTVWLRIEDASPPFDPACHDPRPRLEAGPGQGPEGGFGLYIAMSQVDAIDHCHRGGRNINTLIIRRKGRT